MTRASSGFALGWIRADAVFEGLELSSYSMCQPLSEGETHSMFLLLYHELM